MHSPPDREENAADAVAPAQVSTRPGNARCYPTRLIALLHFLEHVGFEHVQRHFHMQFSSHCIELPAASARNLVTEDRPSDQHPTAGESVSSARPPSLRNTVALVATCTPEKRGHVRLHQRMQQHARCNSNLHATNSDMHATTALALTHEGGCHKHDQFVCLIINQQDTRHAGAADDAVNIAGGQPTEGPHQEAEAPEHVLPEGTAASAGGAEAGTDLSVQRTRKLDEEWRALVSQRMEDAKPVGILRNLQHTALHYLERLFMVGQPHHEVCKHAL